MSDVAAAYDVRGATHLAAARDARARAGRIAAARLVVAVALLLLVAAVFGGELARTPATIAGAVLVVILAALARVHGRARAAARDAWARHAACVRGAARVRREWKALREPAWAREHADGLPPIADDLRLVGRASIAQLLDVVSPAVGGERLRAWLLADPPTREVIVARQQAVREIASRTELLETCAAAGADAGGVPRRTVDALLEWAGTPGPVPRIAALAYVAPLLTAAGVAAWLRGVPASVALGPALLVNTGVALALQARLRAVLGDVADLPALLGPALALLDRWATEPLASPAWRDVQTRLAAGDGSRALGRLRRVLTWSETRYSPMLHWALNAAVAWDAHVLRALERWRHTCGPAVPGWLAALADAEALTALATLAHDNPAWALPTLAEGTAPNATTLEATALAHPLLAPAAAVGNDARLAGPGSLLVISGSNMAGKTTLLRALGANVVLAQAGGPVCAAAMRWRPLRVRTSIHVRDALDEGVSLFLAELRRLKAIVDAADETRADDGAPVLALLDEVLHGTNSRDRRAATRAILARLHAAGAVTVVTTHDLELADEPALAPTTAHLHFREQYLTGADGPAMRFDYVAREGKAVSTNAMALLAALGLSAER